MNKKISTFRLQGLFSYLMKRGVLRFTRKKTRSIQIIFHQKVALDPVDLEQKYLAADCVREPENLLVYRALAGSGVVDTFVDIGANCGHVAASVMHDYQNVLLFEPNPKLAALLRELYKNQRNIVIKECAIVDEGSAGTLSLTVPDESSGLATLGRTNLSGQHDRVHTYPVRATTLASEVAGYSLNTAYIKIDVEGFEENIISSARDLINRQRPIVGFEALSNLAAESCVKLFEDYVFYCARFDFLDNHGALSKSFVGITKALLFGGSIEILKLGRLQGNEINNFSQIYSVPKEKLEAFEEAVLKYNSVNPVLDLKALSTWS
ncbi:MAG: FkbM family methyltransferase [Polaromonas sp.]|nr:FkbM family methyltransferase [Polaromonas sp.]